VRARRGPPGRRSGADRSPELFLDPTFALANAEPADYAPLEPNGVATPEAVFDAPGESAATAIPVAALTEAARDVVEGAFPRLWVIGEVTDFKRHRNGHWYFCLKDAESSIRCVVWSRDQRRIPAPPDEGMLVTVLGQLTVYPARGEMQLVVTAMEAEGDGLTRKAIKRILARLEADGLLAPERKRALPRFPRRIAVVTSPDGAAIRDIAAVTRRRSPSVEIVVVAAAVQGDNAPDELCAALDLLARWGDCDVAIIGRGGGAREDLRAFNNERVVRAVAALPMPVISAVGHEIDMTLCDLVADLRAATPSVAAEAAVPVHAEVVASIVALRDELILVTRRRLDSARLRVDTARRAAAVAGTRAIERKRSRIEMVGGRLHALSPLATLARGYAVARGEDGVARPRAAAFTVGERFELLMHDGVVGAHADDVRVGETLGEI
jgi:exodeoxyribonuclease VII large subunit